MRTIETTATITPDGVLTAKVPSDVRPGERHVVLVIEDALSDSVGTAKPALQFHTASWTGWPADATFRREDIYDNDGR
jgi:hypothetical protein